MLQQIETKSNDSTSKLGVEIIDVNLKEKLPLEIIKKIRSAWLEKGVAIFPNQKLSHDEFQNFSLEQNIKRIL